MLQRYVSKELTHFVGRSLASDDERYELLLKILRDGLLKAKGITDNEIENDSIYTDINFYSRDRSKGRFSNETLVETYLVCFCDIPVNDFSIHISKYGRFGLSFPKEFMIENRANPVFYVALDSKPTFRGMENRKAYFDKQLPDFAKLMHIMLRDKELGDSFEKALIFFVNEILFFLKPFECNKSDTDEENYYMEREWRVLGFVKFTLEDVSRIILPKSYIRRFRDDIQKCCGQDYYGQITFADEYSLSE